MPRLALTALGRIATFGWLTWLRIVVPFLGAIALGWWLDLGGGFIAFGVIVASFGGLLRFGLWERRQTELGAPATEAKARASLRRHPIMAGFESVVVGALIIVTIAERLRGAMLAW